jgi:hypothetical protein
LLFLLIHLLRLGLEETGLSLLVPSLLAPSSSPFSLLVLLPVVIREAGRARLVERGGSSAIVVVVAVLEERVVRGAVDEISWCGSVSGVSNNESGVGTRDEGCDDGSGGRCASGTSTSPLPAPPALLIVSSSLMLDAGCC